MRKRFIRCDSPTDAFPVITLQAYCLDAPSGAVLLLNFTSPSVAETNIVPKKAHSRLAQAKGSGADGEDVISKADLRRELRSFATTLSE